MGELVNYLSCQNGCQLTNPILQSLVHLVMVVQSKIADIDKASDFKLSEILVYQLLIICVAALLWDLVGMVIAVLLLAIC